MSENVLPVLSSRSLMVSCLMFKPLKAIFSLFFVHGVRVCSNSIDFTCSCPIFPAPLAEEAFPYFIFLPPLSKIN